jgi:hypothetical protein
MAKLILLSIVIVSAAVPLRLSARPAARRALQNTQWTMVAFIVVWALMCIMMYPTLVPLE